MVLVPHSKNMQASDRLLARGIIYTIGKIGRAINYDICIIGQMTPKCFCPTFIMGTKFRHGVAGLELPAATARCIALFLQPACVDHIVKITLAQLHD